MLLGSLGFLNLLTAVFIDSLMERRNQTQLNRARAKARWLRHVHTCSVKLFHIADEDGDEVGSQ